VRAVHQPEGAALNHNFGESLGGTPTGET
jgi:hypothetical protein